MTGAVRPRAGAPRSGPGRPRVAVIGAGIAGLAAAHELERQADVTLFEADERAGGHADTHRVGDLMIDTGFIVHNRRTYPHLLRLFAELGVETQPSEMSLSMRSDADGVEWAGALGWRGLFPARANLTRAAYLRMLTEIPRFHRRARRLLAAPDDGSEETLAAFLDRGRFTPFFRRHFMAPLVAAVWSCDPEQALEFPARYLFEFLAHHGMLAVFGSPQWRTVSGGSRTYVDAILAGLADVRLGTKVTGVRETGPSVEVTDGNGSTHLFDAVVVAVHPDQALGMLAEPTRDQQEILGAIDYTPNTALLHTDTSLMPRSRDAWASWNHLERPGRGGVTMTYDLTRLQRLDTDVHYLVSLGAEDLVDPDRVIATRQYAHPLYTPASVAARARQRELDTARVHFAGAWQGWGFHEDGARSGVEAARRILALPDRSKAIEPVVHRTTVRHVRRHPMRREFTLRSHTWVVDLDRLPEPGRLGHLQGSFEARDHLGDPESSIRDNVDRFLARHGVQLHGGRVLMAAQPRAWGYCFNPISVFWCFDTHHELAGVIVEVHNTYGERHAYLVHPDERGNAWVDKAMYVSPFHGTDGRYLVHVPVPGRTLDVAVALHTDDGALFSASLTGSRTPGGRGDLVRAAPAALRGSLLIRLHGISLWLRRLPVRPRPHHRPQEGVQ
ncbi:FAD-dependent oxidoreductase [Nocardioides daejeonensis]|uniref:FAD-dependent oxidoreductase n=1 Tax=Nocardioides daejeonensis TaxID=1046556 RepID=UPI000D74C6EC|nr:FAD-dependent oxidoreductase [Nocardioides daejeonensis]